MAKFYYDGHLVRTSKNHDYTHACIVVDQDGNYEGLVGCRKSKELAEAIKSSEISGNKRGIEDDVKMQKALAAGKKYVMLEYNHRAYRQDLSDVTEEKIIDWVNKHVDRIDEITRTWKIVELERVD